VFLCDILDSHSDEDVDGGLLVCDAVVEDGGSMFSKILVPTYKPTHTAQRRRPLLKQAFFCVAQFHC
jgi:hypothetical protein